METSAMNLGKQLGATLTVGDFAAFPPRPVLRERAGVRVLKSLHGKIEDPHPNPLPAYRARGLEIRSPEKCVKPKHLLLLLTFLIAGCASSHNDLTMVSQDQRRDFHQTFPEAFSSLNSNGDYDIVLVHDANADALLAGNGPVKPEEVTPRQLVHIRVYWFPQRGAKLDHPVTTNASVRWYVFGDRPNETANVIEYSGSGLVIVRGKGDTATVTIRGANLKVITRRGQMADPLGPSSVTGVITTLVDRARVDDLLSEVKDIEQSAPLQSASANQQ